MGYSNGYKSNILKIYAFAFLIALHFFGGVLIPFFTEFGRLSFAEILFLQSWFMFCIFLLEIPTGTIADRFGRKTSIALGALAAVIATLVYPSSPSFYIFMLGEFFFALGFSLQSGALDALVYDTLKKTGESKQSKKIFGRLQSFHLAAIMVAAPIGSFVASQFGVTVPLMLTAIPAFLAFLLALTIKEPEIFTKDPSRNYFTILRDGVKFFYNHQVLKILAVDMSIVAAASYFMLWLFQPILMRSGIDIIYFGIIQASFVIAQIVIIHNVHRLEGLLGSKRRYLFVSALLTGLAFIAAGLTSYAPFAILAIIIGGGFGLSRTPLFSSYLNKHIPSGQRATVLSTVSMVRRMVLVVVNPLVGMAVDLSLSVTLLGIGLITILFSFISRVEEKHLKD